MRQFLRLSVILVAVGAALLSSTSRAAAPTLTTLFPAGGQRGAKVDVKCTGTFSWPVKVWSPGAEVVVSKDSGQIQIAIPADLAADRLWIRLYNDEGVSAPLAFLVDSLPDFAEKEPNNSLAEAQLVANGQGIANGILQSSGDVDSFSIEVEKGQTFVASLAAFDQIGSPFDGVLQIANPAGFVVAENHDGIGLDPRLAYTAAESGKYVVRVFGFPSQPNSTISFAGAATYVYRLTITSGPFIANAGPLSVPLTSDAPTASAVGWNIPDGTALAVKVAVDGFPTSLVEFESNSKKQIADISRIGFVHATGFGGSVRVRRIPHPVHPGVVSGESGNPLKLTPPISVTSCLEKPKDEDHFLIGLVKGQAISISAESSSFGLPAVPLMRLSNPDGTDAASTPDPRTAKETLLRYTAKVDGEHLLRVHDRYRHGSARHIYQLTIIDEVADFELGVPADSVSVAADKPTEVEVSIVRRNAGGGKIGPITISFEGLPTGVTASPVVSEITGDTQKKVKLSITSSGGAFSGPIRVIGSATEPSDMKRSARTPVKLGNCFETIWLTVLPKK